MKSISAWQYALEILSKYTKDIDVCGWDDGSSSVNVDGLNISKEDLSELSAMGFRFYLWGGLGPEMLEIMPDEIE